MEGMKQFRDTHIWVSYEGEIFNFETKKFLKKSTTKQGYYRVHPHINKKHINFFVSRMVAECWIPNPENKPFVLHNDNNPKNNNVPNLRWGTQSENILQAYNDNRISAKGEKNGQAKISNIHVVVIREVRKEGHKVKHIAHYFKISHSYMNGICSGRVRTND